MIVVTLPMPDSKLALNAWSNWRTMHGGQQEQHKTAALLGRKSLWDAGWDTGTTVVPYAASKVSVFIDVERAKRGKVWDTAGIIEACKGYCDGLEGVIYANDSQIRSFQVRWDAKPTGNGLIHLYIRSLRESQDWPSVAWATEEW